MPPAACSMPGRFASVLVGFALMLAASGAVAGEQKNAPVESSLRETLSSRQYRFCNEPEYPLMPGEARWCDSVNTERCPGLKRNCDNGAALLGAKEGMDARRSGARAGSIVTATISWAFWLLVAAAVGAIVFLVARRAVGRSRDDDDRDTNGDQAPLDDQGNSRAAAAVAAAETDVQRLLAAAKAAATQGRHDQAIELAHAAMVRALERDGLIRIHPSRTNGDHLRDLAARPDLRSAAREIIRELERVQFGAQSASPAASARVIDRVVAATTGQVGRALLLALAVSLTVSSCTGRGDEDDAPSGTHAVMSFLKRRGIEARLRMVALATLPASEQQLVLLPGAPLHDRETARTLLGWAQSGGVLFVAGALPEAMQRELGVTLKPCKERTSQLTVTSPFQDSLGSFRIETPARMCLQLTNAQTPAPPPAAGAKPAAAKTKVQPARADDDDDEDDDGEKGEEAGEGEGAGTEDKLYVLLERGTMPYAVVLDHPKGGQVVVFADNELFTNAALSAAQNGAFIAELLGRHSNRVDFVNELTGAAAATPMSAIKRGKLAPFMAQLFVLLGLILLWRGSPFGTPRDGTTSRRRNFAEHVRAVGALYARARASRHALSLLSAFALERMRERLHLRGRRGLSALAETIAARTGRPLGDVARVLAEAWDVSEQGSPSIPRGLATEQDMQTMRQLLELLAAAGGRTTGKGHSSS